MDTTLAPSVAKACEALGSQTQVIVSSEEASPPLELFHALHLREQARDPALVAAYTAKRAKEVSAVAELFSPEAMRAAYALAETALDALEHKLERSGAAWLFGDALTITDLFWGNELLRVKNMGVAVFWEGGRRPRVEAFSAATRALPAIRSAIIEWPGAMY